MIQLFRPVFDKEAVLQEVGDCLDKGWTGIGYKTRRFEDEWKIFTGHPHALFLNSATAGLHLALELAKTRSWWSWDWQPTKVLTTPLTFVSTNHAIKHAGLEPVFCDVDGSLNLDPAGVQRALTQHGDVMAVMFVCMGGSSTHLAEIAELCARHRKLLIVDAAHAAGTPDLVGDYIVYSFQAVKNLPTGDSGMLCCALESDDALARKLSWLGITRDSWDRVGWDYDVPYLGWKYNGNSIMASIGLAQLPALRSDNARRRCVAVAYDRELVGCNKVPHSPNSSRHLYQIRVDEGRRDDIIRRAAEGGVQLGVHYRCNLDYPMYRGDCPHASSISKQLISLPMGVHLSQNDVDRVIEVVNECNSV